MEPEPEPSDRPRSRWKAGCIVAAVLALWASYGCGSPIHWSDDIRVTIIDEETGQPLPGVVAVAVWWIGSFNGSHNIIAYRAEAVSNANGEFVIDGMPLRIRPPLTWFKNDDPDIRLYKPGYRGELLNNAPLGQFGFDTRSAKRSCYWNGKTVPLERAKTSERAVRALESTRLFAHTSHLSPKDFPLFWNAIVAGYDGLPRAGQVEYRRSRPSPHDEVSDQESRRW